MLVEWMKCKVCTIKKYLFAFVTYSIGREFKIVIISTVRARQTWHKWKQFDTQHHLGFVADPKRLNTAMTRAQSLLVFVGDPYVLYRYSPSLLCLTLNVPCINIRFNKYAGLERGTPLRYCTRFLT